MPHGWLAAVEDGTKLGAAARRLVKQKRPGGPPPLIATAHHTAAIAWLVSDGQPIVVKLGRCRDERAGGKMRAA